MAAHSPVSPSSSSRWLVCTPSALEALKYPNKSSAAADEGTLAHALGELLLLWELGRIGVSDYNRGISEIEQSQYYNTAMLEYMQGYSGSILAATSKKSQIFIEERVNFDQWMPEFKGEGESPFFGTTDCVIITEDLLDFWDLKYGKGVEVSAVKNSQLMMYALGAFAEFGFLYPIKRVRMNIYQPRLNNHSVWEISLEELLDWAEKVLRPQAALAYNGGGDYVAGTHCKFCPAKASCRKLADYSQQIMKRDFAPANTLDDDEIADVLSRLDVFEIWAKAVKDFAFEQALAGKKWKGFKLVEGRSNRVISDVAAAEKVLKPAFGDVIYKPQELLGVTALEKAVGKTQFNELVGPFIVKPPGKPALAKESDTRKEFNSAENAFKGITHEEDFDI